MKTNSNDFMREDLKKLFKGYRTMNKSVRHNLKKLGFTVCDAGKHYKLYYLDDFCHPFSIAKTASDYRCGLNIAAIIAKAIAV